MIALPGRTREVSEIEPPELRLRNGLLFFITLGQAAKYDSVEVDIRIHNVVRSTFRFLTRIPGALGGTLAWFVPTPGGIALPRGEKLGILVRLTNHKILETREFVANSQRFGERRYPPVRIPHQESLMASGKSWDLGHMPEKSYRLTLTEHSQRYKYPCAIRAQSR